MFCSTIYLFENSTWTLLASGEVTACDCHIRFAKLPFDLRISPSTHPVWSRSSCVIARRPVYGPSNPSLVTYLVYPGHSSTSRLGSLKANSPLCWFITSFPSFTQALFRLFAMHFYCFVYGGLVWFSASRLVVCCVKLLLDLRYCGSVC